jgi:hypothetical protein
VASIRPAARSLALALFVALIATPLAPLAQTARVCTVRVTLLQVNDVYRFTPAAAQPCKPAAAVMAAPGRM